jgi:hypothetical protein
MATVQTVSILAKNKYCRRGRDRGAKICTSKRRGGGIHGRERTGRLLEGRPRADDGSVEVVDGRLRSRDERVSGEDERLSRAEGRVRFMEGRVGVDDEVPGLEDKRASGTDGGERWY